MTTIFILYILLGVFAGTLAGFFGIGGGVILVPSLIFCFKLSGIPNDVFMHMALGTSLACIFITALNSVWSHHKNGNTHWLTFKLLFPGIIIGTLIGAQVANKLSSHTLEIIFTVFLFLIFIKMCFQSPISQSEEKNEKKIGIFFYSVVGTIIGFKSAVLGIGGGTISIPFVTWSGKSIKKAIGISSSICLPISFFGAISYIYNGWSLTELPQYSFGYIYMPAFIGIISTSAFFARIGAKLSHNISPKKLHFLFCIFLFCIVVKTYLSL